MTDPFKGRRGIRGPKKFSFTYADMSEATGIKEGTLRKQVHDGKFDPNDLISLVNFIIRENNK